MKEVLQRRILLSRLLLAVIVVPAAGIAIWLFLIKAPPRNAVIIEENPGPESVGDIRVVSTLTPGAQAPPGSPTSSVAQVPTTTSIPAAIIQPESVASPTIGTIVVFVSGAVSKPGVYTLPAGSRVGDAVSMAGGLRPDADLEQINLAARIVDEEHVSVPEKGATPVVFSQQRQPTPPHPTPIATPKPGVTEKININKATATELEDLPGIGPSLAERIVAFREANGPFKNVEELTLVPGIKEGIMSSIRALITAGP